MGNENDKIKFKCKKNISELMKATMTIMVKNKKNKIGGSDETLFVPLQKSCGQWRLELR